MQLPTLFIAVVSLLLTGFEFCRCLSGAVLSCPTDFDETSAITAAKIGDIFSLECLMNAGADINFQSKEGLNSPLMWAAMRNQ